MSRSAALTAAALAWAALVFGLQARFALSQLPRGFTFWTFVVHVSDELSTGPNFGAFWAGQAWRLAAGALFFAGAFALGRRLLRLFPPDAEASQPEFEAPFALGLGLGGVGLAGFALAALRLSRPWLAAAGFSAACLAGAFELARAWKEMPPAAPAPKPTGLEKAAFGVLLVPALGVLLFNTLPELFYDSLTYHLAVPQAYLHAGGMIDLPANHFSYLPLLASTIYLWGLAAGGMYMAKILSLGIGLAVAWTLFRVARALGERAAGLFAAASFFSTPLVSYLFWTCNSDLLASLFVLLALLAAPRRLALAGLFAGLALSTKYTAAFGVALIGCWAAWTWLKGRASGRSFALFCALTLLPLLPWWARNYAYTGNPVYPYLTQRFDSAGWRDETREGSPGPIPWRHAQKLWRDAIYGQYPTSDYSSPLFVAFFALMLLQARRPGVGLLAGFGGGALLLGMSATYLTRLMVPYFVPLCLAASLAAASLRGRAKAAGLGMIGAIALFCSYQMAIMFCLTSLRGLIVPTGRETPAQYLSQHRNLYPYPSYPAYEALGRLPLRPGAAVLVVGDSRLFYCPVRAYGNAPHDAPLIWAWAAQAGTPEKLWEELRRRGIEAVIWNGAESQRTDDPRYVTEERRQLIAHMLTDHFLKAYADQTTALYVTQPGTK